MNNPDNERKQTLINNADKLINIIQDAHSPNPIDYLEQEINKIINKHEFLKKRIKVVKLQNKEVIIIEKIN